MRISISIPAYNEAESIAGAIEHLRSAAESEHHELIVSDGGSADDTCQRAGMAGVLLPVSPVKGRAGQMNHGAKRATGEIRYFVHADTRAPKSFAKIIAKAVAAGHDHGGFRTRFDDERLLLRANAFFTRFDKPYFRGGDQSLWVKRDLFERCGGYKENMLIMEEYVLLDRLRQIGNFHLSNESTVISARKYTDNTWLRVQLANLKVVRMYHRGASQEELLRTYRKMLNYRKNAF